MLTINLSPWSVEKWNNNDENKHIAMNANMYAYRICMQKITTNEMVMIFKLRISFIGRHYHSLYMNAPIYYI